MRPLNQIEIMNISNKLKTYVQCPLQKIFTTKDCVIFQLYSFQLRKKVLICFDLNLSTPWIFSTSDEINKQELKKTPLQLFLSAHGEGTILIGIDCDYQNGRVVKLLFGKEFLPNCKVEVRLFPRGSNMKVVANEKEIWWRKPKELIAPSTIESSQLDVRSIEVINEIGVNKNHSLFSTKKISRTLVDQNILIEAYRSKLQKSIAKIKNDLIEKNKVDWQSAGESLQQNPHILDSSEWDAYFDSKKSWEWNLNNCFENSKKLKEKRKRTESRLNELEAQLQDSFNADFQLPTFFNHKQNKSISKDKPGKSKYRQMLIGNEWVCRVGRSAKDNIDLLRNSKPWDLWIHLKDIPGSHGFIQKNKSEIIKSKFLIEACNAVARETFGAKSNNKVGEKLTAVVTECRFVKPIKGDKLGRVTYTSSQSLSWEFY